MEQKLTEPKLTKFEFEIPSCLVCEDVSLGEQVPSHKMTCHTAQGLNLQKNNLFPMKGGSTQHALNKHSFCTNSNIRAQSTSER